MSPEMVLSVGHRDGVDWWSLGVLVFEMFFGVAPFNDHPYGRKEYTMWQILNHNIGPHIEHRASDEGLSLIHGLLERDVSTRIGASPLNPREVCMAI